MKKETFYRLMQINGTPKRVPVQAIRRFYNGYEYYIAKSGKRWYVYDIPTGTTIGHGYAKQIDALEESIFDLDRVITYIVKHPDKYADAINRFNSTEIIEEGNNND